MTRRIWVHALATAASMTIVLLAPMSMAGSSPNPVNVDSDKVAIKGYDTVAYFTNGQPTKGNSEFVFTWNGARWQFASAAHRDMFAANPERYAPQFGQFCSMGLALGKRAIADPEVWKIVDDKLYLYFSRGARDKFQQDAPKNLKEAEANWQHHNDLPWAGQK
jgi:YHS domain-containing protein